MARPSQNPITLTRGESRRGFLRKRTRRVRSGSGIYLAHNSAKLKIFNLPTSIQLLRFGANLRFALAKPHGFAVARSPVRCQRSAGRWVCSHGSEERCRIDTKTTARFRRAAVFTALALELGGASRPAIHLLSGACQASGSSPRFAQSGGDEETRTPDPLLAKEMLCQLSYVPRRQGSGGRYWTRTSDLCLIRAAL